MYCEGEKVYYKMFGYYKYELFISYIIIDGWEVN